MSDAVDRPEINAPAMTSSASWRQAGWLGNLARLGSRPVSDDSTSRKVRPWSRSDTSISNTWQLLAGAVLVPSGVLFIILGWYGAAHASYVQQQIPYLASGVGIGLACVALGASLYWSHWLYRVYDQADLHHAELLEQSERHHQEQLRTLEDALSAPTGGRADTTRSRRTQAVGAKAVLDSPFLATASGTSYHVANCPILAHHGAGTTPLSAADVKKMKPCRICAPGAATK